MGALRSYVSVSGANPYMLLEWPASMDLPRVGSHVSLKLLLPVEGMGTSTEGLAAVFSKMELGGLKVVSIEGRAAREYSNVLHHNAPTKDARAVKLEIPADVIRTPPGDDDQTKGGSSKRGKRRGAKELPTAGKLRKVERLGRVPEVARGPVELLDPRPGTPASPTAGSNFSSAASSSSSSAGSRYRPRIAKRDWAYVLAGIGSVVVLAGAAALVWGGAAKKQSSKGE